MDMQSYNSENYSSSTRYSPTKWSHKDEKGYIYKKSNYQHFSTGEDSTSYKNKSVDQNIDQLDALLEDLKNEREFNTERDHSSSTLNYKTVNIKPVSVLNLQDSGEESQYQSKIYVDEKNIAENSYKRKPKIYGSNHIIGNTEVASTTLKEDLQSVALSEDILPLPGTKVTTTVRTYTYEVPSNYPSQVKNYRNQQYINYNTNEFEGHTNLPPTVVYNVDSFKTVKEHDENPIITHRSFESRQNDELITMNNYLPKPDGQHIVPPNVTSKTIVYNTNENINMLPEKKYPDNIGLSPQTPQNVLINNPESVTSSYYKKSTTVINASHPPSHPYQTNSSEGPNDTILLPYKVPRDGYERETTPSVTYKYSTSTTNSRRGPKYGTPSPTLPPAPFPIEEGDYPVSKSNPPQRVDDLMKSFGNSDTIDKSGLNPPYRKREIETSVASSNQQQIPSINKAGKEIYYPPGHDMMLTKREEMSMASASGGRWAKGSSMYEYESGYKSKTKTKSGGAMVPVCLPLCCAMPCTIM